MNEPIKPLPKQAAPDSAPIVLGSMARQQKHAPAMTAVDPVIAPLSTLAELGEEPMAWKPPSRWWGINE